MKITDRLLRPLSSRTSIQKQIQFSYIFIICLMLFPSIYALGLNRYHTYQYNRIITSVSRANTLNQIVSREISDAVWDIVAGKVEFSNGRQYLILFRIKEGLSDIQEKTNSESGRQLLEVAGRAVNTLEKYIDFLGEQEHDRVSVDETEKTMEDIRSVSGLISDIMQRFIVSEIEGAETMNRSITKSSVVLTWVAVAIIALVVAFAVSTLISVSKNIRQPISELEKLSSEIAAGNLEARAKLPEVDELDNLTNNLNTMAGKLRDLMDENMREQQEVLKAEMKTLQAQITPHFLYNTFDTIIWLAEAGKKKEVIEITRSFSQFFRISLSKGHEWITVAQEMEHVQSYLTIQKIRYSDIFDYDVSYDPDMAELPVLKLVLQPLVENAIYHGVKNKRGKGKLSVTGRLEGDSMIFTVSDNGIGMTSERLAEVTSEIAGTGSPESLASVYGLYNVSRRLRLYYNQPIDLHIESTYRRGTVVSYAVPVIACTDVLDPGNTENV